MSHNASKSRSPCLGDSLAGVDASSLRDHGFASQNRIDFMALPLIAEGGEGWILDASEYRKGEVLKLFKPPAMVPFPDQAAQKWDEYPRKFIELDKIDFPSEAVIPTKLVTEEPRGKQVLGYFMPRVGGFDLTELTTRPGRIAHSVSKNGVMELIRMGRELIEKAHSAGFIIGDNKPNNYRVEKGKLRLLDIESVAIPGFDCRGFTEQYVDPLICDPKLEFINRIKPYTAACDWYALDVMLFECLTGIHPFGGVHTPQDEERAIADAVRSLRGVSVLSKEVTIPSFIESFAALPPALIGRFRKVFEERFRKPITTNELEASWINCERCELEHTRCECPQCSPLIAESTISRPGMGKHKARFERVEGDGIAVAVSPNNGHATPLISRLAGNNGKLSLSVNGRELVRGVSLKASLNSTTSESSLYLAEGGKIRAYDLGQERAHCLDRIMAGSDGEPLFAATKDCIAYIDTAGQLCLSKTDTPERGMRYAVDIKRGSHITVNQKLIALADTNRISVFHISPRNGDLVHSQIRIEPSLQVVGLQAHPAASRILVTATDQTESNWSCMVLEKSGISMLELASSRPTKWWFNNTSSSEEYSLLYWQREKFCCSVVNEQTRSLSLQWGIDNAPEPDPGQTPVIQNNRLFYISNQEVCSISLL